MPNVYACFLNAGAAVADVSQINAPVGDVAFDLPGSNVSKGDLPNRVKPSEAKGLPDGPTAKPPALPSLPKVAQTSWLIASTA